ncbi:triose-phosphate isomerase [Patescibacteria group bacterium]|nr:MAG: triose-phosphate isomerase [Patescibacteria group bacterium]
MARNIVIANWKMNPASPVEAKRLFASTRAAARALRSVEVVIAPPVPFLSLFAGKRYKNVRLGAQDVFWQSRGAVTGEVSPAMLASLGVRYVIVGHSERRALGESDEIVSRKVSAALSAGLTPILCVGEGERDEHGAYLHALAGQIRRSLAGLTKNGIPGIIVAYEPVWAIGKTARDALSARGLHETTLFIQKTLNDLYGRRAADTVRIVYGGSVEANNAAELIREGNVSGFLVGHASLSRGFREILRAVGRL